MAPGQPSLDEMKARLQTLTDGIARECQTIAGELARPRKMNKERIFAAETAITRQIVPLRVYFTQFDAAYHASAAPQEIGGEERRIVPEDWLAFSAQVGHVRNWINRWDEVHALIQRQCPPRRHPLTVGNTTAGPVYLTALSAADRMLDRLHHLHNPNEQSAVALANNCFPDIALPQSDFVALCMAAWRILKAQGRHTGTRFIDVGCGGGFKVLTALEFFDAAYGMEYDPDYAEAARALFGKTDPERLELLEGDALAFESYDYFDVIYLYRPIKDPDLMQQLERKIVNSVRPGTVLIAPHTEFRAQLDTLACSEIAPRIFMPGLGSRKTASLRRDAELIGPELTPRHPPLSSIWDPIFEASRSRGY
ncbi:methyltransferase domain-containing protein [Tropicimonas sp. IMCC6043]|uniref:methyltransferase domain-containing protein n=1 Tax=Tropicimonas sp. IMCC6043 TaxID=2510645 RepID=UPI00101DDF56|nr:methyltransferase domain-containing protein [Tropicimonas sp. IMCC6043]RYH08893.1 methyltransferase domain-containing protein [Tropicimonas sp. IMCC6043]